MERKKAKQIRNGKQKLKSKGVVKSKVQLVANGTIFFFTFKYHTWFRFSEVKFEFLNTQIMV